MRWSMISWIIKTEVCVICRSRRFRQITLTRKITGIFKRQNIPVRVAHKSYTLSQALSHNKTERKCNRPNCPIADTNLCLQRNTVYQLTCKDCGEYYIGSTTRFLHDRTKEHLANDNSSVKKHLTTHHRINNHNIEVKVITRWTWHDKSNICSRYCIYHVKFTSYCELIECSRPIRFSIVSLMYNNIH